MEMNVPSLWLKRHVPIFIEKFGTGLSEEDLQEKVFEYLDSCNSYFLIAMLESKGIETLIESFIEEIKTYD
jgi:hypothetical protein